MIQASTVAELRSEFTVEFYPFSDDKITIFTSILCYHEHE